MPNMGMAFGLESDSTCFKRKNRWLFKIGGVSASGVNSLPPSKAARPSLSFKEMDVQHLTETVYFPTKPEWKPINLTLYDTQNSTNPVMTWLRRLYDMQNTNSSQPSWGYSAVEPGEFDDAFADDLDSDLSNGFDYDEQGQYFKVPALLELYSGCGTRIEAWAFDNAWPQDIQFGDLDMAASDILTVDITLRYDRAYIIT